MTAQSSVRKRVTEKELLQQVRDLATLCGFAVYHTHDSRRSEPGYPDLTMVRGGRLIFVELKSERGWVTPEQRAWLQRLEQVPGVECFVWRPSSWGEIERTLAR